MNNERIKQPGIYGKLYPCGLKSSRLMFKKSKSDSMYEFLFENNLSKKKQKFISC
jgi:hypothetical protein